MDTATRVQVLDEAVFFSHKANILWNDMNPIIFLLAKDRYGESGLFKLVMATSLGERNV